MRLRILLADDNEIVRRGLIALLQKHGDFFGVRQQFAHRKSFICLIRSGLQSRPRGRSRRSICLQHVEYTRSGAPSVT